MSLIDGVLLTLPHTLRETFCIESTLNPFHTNLEHLARKPAPGFIHAIKSGHFRQEMDSDFPVLLRTLPVSSVQEQAASLPLHYTCRRPQHRTETQGPMGVWGAVQGIVWRSSPL